MAFLFLLGVMSLLAWVLARVSGHRCSWRTAMRVGAGLAFLWTGTDHFLSDEVRYLPMMPAFFGAWSLPLVWFTGAAEMLGGLALILPQALCQRWQMPRLHQAAGVALALLLLVMVMANINVALQGRAVAGLETLPDWYGWVRPLLQPLIVLWVLYATHVIGRGRPELRHA